MEPEDKDEEEKSEEKHHHRPHGPHGEDNCGHPHGPDFHRGGPRPDFPPHLMREIMEMKEKIGRLEGMMEVLMKKM